MSVDVAGDLHPEFAGPGSEIRWAAFYRRPRCWCGCPETGHRRLAPRTRRSCERCGPGGCPAYVPGNQLGPRVTAAHHVARARSDQRVRAALDALFPHARDAPDDSAPLARLPRQRTNGPG